MTDVTEAADTADRAGATALVVQHTERGGPGRWREWLAEGGLACEVVRGYAGEELPSALRPRYAALVVLGGGYLPDDDARAPWLARTRALAKEALGSGVPVFGICLGGQLLAQVAGGRVRADAGRPEFGSTEVALRQEAAGDPLFAGLPARPRAIENHVDAITELPPGAVWLASSADCPYQAFRVGEAAWGVQFHPEADAGRIGGWDAARLARYGADRAALERAALAHEAESAAVWREVALRFARHASGRAGAAAPAAPAGTDTPD